MRIITGKLKGRTIPVPKTDLLRPTTDRTKEGLFSVIEARTWIENSRVLDLFAGSGNLGFEAISRGASTCLFVDREIKHSRHIEDLAKKFEVQNQVQTVTSDIETFLEKGGRGSFDFIFADPPYDYFMMHEMTETILNDNWLNDDGWFILEHDKRLDFSEHEKCVFSKAYGRTIVAIFKHNDEGFN
ncbi:MAG: 16S rRNA (guanine(966)-N(2))-methyltransferase RsmD [Balneolaceae bacterium]|nr:MAG: 16S rRNA (guanine(966)-N(2))-methyltransferase RsmD [Balneolaceae bacterium]